MEETLYEIIDKPFQNYAAYLYEKRRPPSRGGNTGALHRHVLIIDGEKYTFFARGAKKFAYKGETISFQYKKTENNGAIYNNIEKRTISSKDKKGKVHIRGDRTFKKKIEIR